MLLPGLVLFHLWEEALNITGKVFWAGKSGIKKIENIDLKDIPVQIAGQVPWGEGENDFNPDTVMASQRPKEG